MALLIRGWLLWNQFPGYTPLLQFIMTQQWLKFGPPTHGSELRTRPACASFLVMAVVILRTRVQLLFRRKQRLFSAFCRHDVVRRSMASGPSSTDITRFDFLVIGGGSGGLAGARRASELGASAAVIESHKLGGTCVSKIRKIPLSSPNDTSSDDCLVDNHGIKMINIGKCLNETNEVVTFSLRQCKQSMPSSRMA